ncbi:MAG: hypothetical protein WC205_18845 [Opitutaceae bacterium]|jgi:hypothetical protein
MLSDYLQVRLGQRTARVVEWVATRANSFINGRLPLFRRLVMPERSASTQIA